MRAGRAGRGQRADRPARGDRGGPRDPGARRAAHKDTPPWRTFPRVRPADRGTRRGRRPTNSGPPGARGGAGCPNLLQRPGLRRSAGEESLVFRAFIRGRSCRGAPLWQIRTRPAPDRPRSPTRTTPRPAFPHRRADRRRITRVGCAISGWSGRSCTFDRDPLSEDPRNHAETPRRSTPLKSSHAQTGALCTWDSTNERSTIRKNRGIMRETRGRPVRAPLSDVQYPHYPERSPRHLESPAPSRSRGRGDGVRRERPHPRLAPLPRSPGASAQHQGVGGGTSTPSWSRTLARASIRAWAAVPPSAVKSRDQPAISRTGPSSPWGRLGCSTAHGPSV